jgi:molybdopterin-synthase adenylyltransferase
MQDINRYQRQYLFEPLGEKGQKKICASRVAVIGCGALGSAIASTLARAGVGFLRIIDRDLVELNNLHRQILFDEEDAEQSLPKAIAAAQKIKAMNSQIQAEPVVTDVDFTNIENFLRDVDLVMDGTDNFDTRFLMNEACVKLGKPWIYGACVGSQGLTMTVIPRETPCLRCVFESAPAPEFSPTCDTAGIIAPTALAVASLQCTEAIKWLSGNKNALANTLFSFNMWSREGTSSCLDGVRNRTDCPVCKKGEYAFLGGRQFSKAAVLCGRDAVQINKEGRSTVDLAVLAARLEKVGKVTLNKYAVRAEIEKFKISVFADGRVIIQGTSEPAQAKTVYAKYIGA